MQSYHRLTEGDRHQVYALHKAGLRQSAISEQIGVRKSTIFREVHCNKGLCEYRPKRSYGHFASEIYIAVARILGDKTRIRTRRFTELQ